MRRRHSVEVTVEVDLEGFDDEDLIEELNARGYNVLGSGSAAQDWQKLADAFLLKRNATQTLEELVYRNTARIIRVQH